MSTQVTCKFMNHTRPCRHCAAALAAPKRARKSSSDEAADAEEVRRGFFLARGLLRRISTGIAVGEIGPIVSDANEWLERFGRAGR